ncbi:glycosyltransferase, partial [Patescibacteria group bacterium]
MKIIYITNLRIPTEKAHGYQICKMCEEFSDTGIEVELLIPSRYNNIKEDAFVFYELKKNFKIKIIKSFDFIKLEKYFGKFSFYFQKIWFLFKLIFQRISKDNIVYSRDAEIIWLFNLKGNKTVFTAHNWPNSKVWLYKYLLKRVDKIICNSRGTEKKFRDNGFKNTISAPNGVDLEKFSSTGDADVLKKELGLPNKKIIMYSGHLYKWKGVDVVLESAKILSEEKNVVFVLVGGTAPDIKKYKKYLEEHKIDNVIITGYQKRDKIPKYLKCADILLLPNIPISEESISETSPIKMFEYMAVKRPIIASNMTSIREV